MSQGRLLIAGLVIVFALPLVVQAQIYRHVDEDGTVRFTDQPGPDAEEVELDQVPTYQPQRVEPRPRRTPAGADEERPATSGYSEVNVIAPAHEEAVRDNQGNVTVRVGSRPEVADDHQYQLLLDGEVVAQGRGTTFQLENVHRGEYRLQVRIVRGEDDVVAESEPSTFFMLQASRLSPTR